MKNLASLVLLPFMGIAAVATAQDESEISLGAYSQDARYCEAEIALEYLQWDDVARVEGTLTNENCAASSGRYDIEARIRDANGDLQTLRFSESWSREDDRPVVLSSEYEIGDNVELMRLKARSLDCACAGAATLAVPAKAEIDHSEESAAVLAAIDARQIARLRDAQPESGGEAALAGNIESEVFVVSEAPEQHCEKVTVVGSRLPRMVCTTVQADPRLEAEQARDTLRRMREYSTLTPPQDDFVTGSGLPGFQ